VFCTEHPAPKAPVHRIEAEGRDAAFFTHVFADGVPAAALCAARKPRPEKDGS
jgi:hypothetical protein